MIQKLSSQNIDDLIQGIESILKNRCSLLDEDRMLLIEVMTLLNEYKQKESRATTVNLLLMVKAVELLTKFFV